MNCEYNLCIYHKNNKCILTSNSINSFGMCDDCIIINLSEEEISKKRDELLLKYYKEDNPSHTF